MHAAFYSVFFFFPLVSAMTFTVPSNVTSGAPTTLTWTSSAGDPDTFSIELVNTVFHNSFAVANNVQTSSEGITVTIPIVPAGDGYTFEGVNIGNINTVYGTSGGFSIAATVTSSTSSSSTSLSSGSLTSPTGTSTTGSGATVTPTLSSVSSGTSSGASSSASPSAFNGNGAPGSNIGSGFGGSIAAAVVGVIAGAVFV